MYTVFLFHNKNERIIQTSCDILKQYCSKVIWLVLRQVCLCGSHEFLRWTGKVSFTPRPFYPQENSRTYPLNRRLCGPYVLDIRLTFRNLASHIQDGRKITLQMAHFIFIQQISVLNILNMLYNLHFFSSKCRLFHNATLFGFYTTHILNTGCAKI